MRVRPEIKLKHYTTAKWWTLKQMCVSPCCCSVRAFLTLFHTIKMRNICQAQSVWKNPRIQSDVCFQAIPLCVKGLYMISDSFWSFRFSTIQNTTACWDQQQTLWILLGNLSFTSTTDFRPSIIWKNTNHTKKQKKKRSCGLCKQTETHPVIRFNQATKLAAAGIFIFLNILIIQSSLCKCYGFSVLYFSLDFFAI